MAHMKQTNEKTPATTEEDIITASVSTAEELEDLDAPTEEMDILEIPDIPASDVPRRVRNSNPMMSASIRASFTSENTSGGPASVVAREAMTAERLESWNLENEDITTVGIFLTALKEKRILSGTVAGVEANNKTAYWVLYEGPVTVRIPFDNSFMTIPAELAVQRPNEEILRRQRQMLDRAKGAKVHFTISRFVQEDEGSYLATGSRTDALSKIRKHYFGNRADNPLTVGMDIMAQILTNGEHAAYLTFCGVDVKVKKSELSHKFIQDVTSTFHVGSQMRVRIQNITPAAETNGIPSVAVSAKPVERERFKRNLKRIHKNGSYIGTVISTAKKEGPDGSSITISLFLDDVGVPAYSRTTILGLGDAIKHGDKVSFLAMGVNEEGFAHGKIIEVIKPRI